MKKWFSSLKKWYKKAIQKKKSGSNPTAAPDNKKVSKDNSFRLPQRMKGEKKWGIMEKLTGLYVIVSFLAFGGSIYAITVTVTALNEARSEFKTSNRPYLQISHIMDSIRPDATPEIIFEIDNLTNQPTKIMYMSLELRFFKEDTGALHTLIQTKKFESFSIVNQYAIKESPYNGNFRGGYVPKEEYDSIKTKKCFTSFHGKIVYVNLGTNEEDYYLFDIFLTYSGNTIKVQQNENFETHQQFKNPLVNGPE